MKNINYHFPNKKKINKGKLYGTVNIKFKTKRQPSVLKLHGIIKFMKTVRNQNYYVLKEVLT